jgi:hypothetical protein
MNGGMERGEGRGERGEGRGERERGEGRGGERKVFRKQKEKNTRRNEHLPFFKNSRRIITSLHDEIRYPLAHALPQKGGQLRTLDGYQLAGIEVNLAVFIQRRLVQYFVDIPLTCESDFSVLGDPFLAPRRRNHLVQDAHREDFSTGKVDECGLATRFRDREEIWEVPPT